MKLILDIETNGLLEQLDRLHSVVLRDADTGKLVCSADGRPRSPLEQDPITLALAIAADAGMLIGHNVIAFDIPAIQKVYPQFQPKGVVFDTLVAARVLWPSDKLRDGDFKRVKAGKLPGNLVGSHSLKAWGYRIGEFKGEFSGPWDTWTEEMQSYCEQDTMTTLALYNRIHQELATYPEGKRDFLFLEHDVARIIARQERRGFLFDIEKASALHALLVDRRTTLEGQLREAFPDWTAETEFTPQVNNKKLGYVKGVPTKKVRTVQFNPSSRDHIADRLIALRGWKPESFTDTGKPEVDESILAKLPWPEAKLLSEYLMVQKRLGQLVEGKQALLANVARDGRIHGRVNSNGANTGRMTHSSPNLAQVPGGKAPYGRDFRGCFIVPRGFKLVGCDADALELRCLAGYMAPYDGGAYIKVVLEGNKEDGTDIHAVNARALNLNPTAKCLIDGKMLSGRDIAKVWFYAFIYGAGDVKLGIILGERGTDRAKKRRGAESRASFLEKLPALKKLVEAVKATLAKRGYLVGLDGRRLYPRSEHAALNTLLQSAGAIIMKQALVCLEDSLAPHAGRYEYVANVHDEFQIEAEEEIADAVGRTAAESIKNAGERLRFACPLAGNYVVGASWAETH